MTMEYVVYSGGEGFVRLGEITAYAGEVVMSTASYLIRNHGVDVMGLLG
jgi:hypothetical protein